MSTILKGCPFCGSAAKAVNMSDSWFVACTGSNCVGMLGGFETKSEAEAMWQARSEIVVTTAPRLAGLVFELRNLAAQMEQEARDNMRDSLDPPRLGGAEHFEETYRLLGQSQQYFARKIRSALANLEKSHVPD